MQCLIRDIPVYYETYDTGTPIIMLHGFGCDHRLMTGCMEPIFSSWQAEWQRIYLDLPGMGRTPGSEHIKSADDILDLVVDFIDVVIPGQRFLLAGESYGGYLSRGVLLRKFEQVEGMALIAPGITIIADRSLRNVPPRSIIVEDAQLLASLAPKDAEEFGAMAVVQDEYNWERFRDEILSGASVGDEVFLDKIKQGQYGYSFDIDRLLQPFSKPIVILTGRQDHVAGYRDAWGILENYPRATFAVLDRSGHNVHIEQSKLFEALISEWLDRVRESME
jgi:pimeloyl-ACP methyl ester carboxylesterase